MLEIDAVYITSKDEDRIYLNGNSEITMRFSKTKDDTFTQRAYMLKNNKEESLSSHIFLRERNYVFVSPFFVRHNDKYTYYSLSKTENYSVRVLLQLSLIKFKGSQLFKKSNEDEFLVNKRFILNEYIQYSIDNNTLYKLNNDVNLKQ